MRLRNVFLSKGRRWGALTLRPIGERLPHLKKKLTLVHIQMPRNSAHEPVMHKRTRELVFVIRGSVQARVAGRRMRLKRGDALSIPRGAWHQFSSGGGVEVLCIFVPAMDPRSPDIVTESLRRAQ